jgi:tRNA(Ile)-lysidine synthase TilS/MesJ
MSQKVEINLLDRLDRAYKFEASEGQPLRQFLIGKYIPSGSVTLNVNGSLTDDQSYIISKKDHIELRMVRAYQLPEYCQMLEIWDSISTKHKNDSIYTSKILWFKDSGICELKQASIAEEKFPEWLENRFVDSIKHIQCISKNDRVCLPLSGERDSLALLYLLERTKAKLPKFSITGVTVEPTVASLGDLDIAQEAMRSLGITDYNILDANYVKRTMHLKNDFSDVMEKALRNQGRGLTISLWHGIMKACIESFCRENNLSKIAYGYQFEDLIASLLRSNLLGISFGESMQKKQFGDFELFFPLWAITKKELTIYLSLIAPNHQSKQSNPTQYDRGDHNRDIHYFLADMMSTLYPGIGFSLFEAYEKFNSSYELKKEKFLSCSNCLATFPESSQKEDSFLCSTCDYFNQIGEI